MFEDDIELYSIHALVMAKLFGWMKMSDMEKQKAVLRLTTHLCA